MAFFLALSITQGKFTYDRVPAFWKEDTKKELIKLGYEFEKDDEEPTKKGD